MSKGFTINTLYGSSNREIIRTLVLDQMKIIDTKIQTAHQSGFNRIEHELPTNFAINNMDKADAQIMIYSEIIGMYKKPVEQGGKGFDETFINLGTTTILSMQWLNGMDREERERRKKLIMECNEPHRLDGLRNSIRFKS